jgi:hypothetical protein
MDEAKKSVIFRRLTEGGALVRREINLGLSTTKPKAEAKTSSSLGSQVTSQVFDRPSDSANQQVAKLNKIPLPLPVSALFPGICLRRSGLLICEL